METNKEALTNAIDSTCDAKSTISGINSLLLCLLEAETHGSCEAEIALPAVLRLLSDCEADIEKTQAALEEMCSA